MASKSSKTQQTTAATGTQEATPWNASQLTGLYDAAKAAYGKTQGTAGATYGDAGQSAIGAAAGMGQGADAVRGLATDQLSGKYLDAGSNPYLQSAISAAIDPLQHALMTKTLPGITDQSIAQGAYGGTRNSVANTLAINDFNTQAGDIAARMAGENYTNERAIQQGSAGLLGQADALSMAPSQALAAGAGFQEQGAMAGLAQLAAALGVGPNAVNTTTSGTTNATGKTTSNDPLGWFSALMSGASTAAAAGA